MDSANGGSEHSPASPRNRLSSAGSESSDAEEGGRPDQKDDGACCVYCGLRCKASLARCLDCGSWLCNSPIPGSTTHLIFHLLKRSHKALQLHKKSLLKTDLALACYFCANKNVFVLGLCPYMANEVIICCRKLFCSPPETAEVHEVSLDRWEPIIKDKQINPCLLRPAVSPVALRADLLAEFEKRRARDPQARLGDVAKEDRAQGAWRPRVKLQWSNVGEYAACFGDLLHAELQENLQEQEKLRFAGVKAKVERLSAGRADLLLALPLREDFDIVGLIGQEMTLTAGGESFNAVVKRVLDEQLLVEATVAAPLPDQGLVVDVKFTLRTVSFERMMAGLGILGGARLPMHPSLVQILLGNVHALREASGFGFPDAGFSPEAAPGLPALNPSQLEACRASCATRFAILQGPPGTGKSVTSAAIAYCLVRWLRARPPAASARVKVLVCAPSNIVTDHLVGYIQSTGVKVVQVCSRLRETLAGRDAPGSSLQAAILAHLDAHPDDPLARLHRAKGDARLPDAEHRVYLRHLARLEEKILDDCEVVCCTCVSAFDARLRKYSFAHVLIDEATQAVEPECLLPMLKGAQSVVLIGDHKQLGPVVSSADAAARGLKQSLFERIIRLGARPLRLDYQYRMHPALSAFSSNVFYDGSLQNGIAAAGRALSSTRFPWPGDAPLLFWHVAGEEELSPSGTSYLNRQEGLLVEKVLAEFLAAGAETARLAVITAYKGQRAFLRLQMLRSHAIPADQVTALEINSIDGFQGREKDFVVISTVRSSPHGGIGFLRDERRLNVALTRARFGMVLVGNATALARSEVWNNFLAHICEKGLLFEGLELRSLKPSLLHFTPKIWPRAEGDAATLHESSYRVSQLGFTHPRT